MSLPSIKLREKVNLDNVEDLCDGRFYKAVPELHNNGCRQNDLSNHDDYIFSQRDIIKSCNRRALKYLSSNQDKVNYIIG